jgi:uncharacterized protein YdeI (BOF family)
MALMVAGALLGGGAGAKAGEVAPAGSPEVITSVRQFWRITGDAKQQSYHVQLEFVVCYYDPEWKLLWALGDDGVSYIQCGEKRFPIEPGQRILVDGLMSPAIGLSVDKADIKVLADHVPLQPLAWQFKGKAEAATRLPTQLVWMEGFVNREAEIDRTHVLLDMTVGGGPVQTRVLLPNLSPAPQCESAFVQVQGVLVPNMTTAGQLSALALWVARPEDVKVKGWLGTDPRFNEAQVSIEMLPKLAADRIVRVEGTVWSQEPGHSLTLRDDTGQVVILTGQTEPVPAGARVEAIGYPVVQGDKWQLREGLYRLRRDGTATPVRPSKLRLAEQVLELGNEQAARGQRVQLFGVVTWANPAVPFFYMNDASGGIRVVLDGNRNPVLACLHGNTVEVKGVSAASDFAPVVKATDVTVAGSLSLPEARAVTLEQALTGIEEGQWIELRGYLREIGRDGPWACLRLTAAAGEFTAYLPPSDQLAALLGSVVRVRGVCSAIANERRELVGIRLWVPSFSPDYVQVEQAAPADPFSVPERFIAGLRQFSTLEALNRRVRISGVVLLQIPGRYLYLQDETDSLQVLSRDTTPLVPGDRAEVVGFPGREGRRLVLREAVCRRLAAGAEPPPTAVDTPGVVREDLDGHLVRVAGVLLDTTNQDKEMRLLIQADKAVFEAVLDHGGDGGGQIRLVPGSRVALTGVYQIQFDEYRHPRAFQVQLRSSRDVRVLSRPSWWTLRRALTAMGVFALCTALGIGWVLTLRRRGR